MSRFVGIKNGYICLVSDIPFLNNDLELLEVIPELDHLTASDLITNCIVKNGEIKCKQSNKQASQMKVALVGNWKMRCGISTYSENLWPEIIKHIGDFKLFIEKNDIITGDIHQMGDKLISDSQVSSCWKRGESPQLLIKELKAYDPDIILIQHEFGLWPNARYWLSMMSQLSDYRVIVIMHSVFHHRDKTIVEAAMSEIVVHLEGAKTVLKQEKGISAKVHVIPHGCYPLNQERLWNFYKSEKTFMQMGFLFRYKGWENSIRATAILKQKYTDVFFTGLCSESPYAKVEHQIYYNELMQLIEDLNVQENVCILRGYQSDAAIDSFLRTNQATIFPYVSHPEHEVFGVSGAARMAMSKGLPVVTSSVNHFSDIDTIKADTPEQIANELDKLFSDPLLVKQQLEKQQIYVEENSWSNVALYYIKMFEK